MMRQHVGWECHMSSCKMNLTIPKIKMQDVTGVVRLFVKSHIPVFCVLPFIPLLRRCLYHRRCQQPALQYHDLMAHGYECDLKSSER
uniref:Ovule protein n=1 Tax=Syphacia muris TaxID=451379 RepID=A0A0N5AYN1_9BILA